MFPSSPRPKRTVRARIVSADSKAVVREFPDEVYPPGPCIPHTELYDKRYLVDREFTDVHEVHDLPDGFYEAKAELVDELGNVHDRDTLSFEVAPVPFLKHRIRLADTFREGARSEARFHAGRPWSGDLDGDGEMEYVNVTGSAHVAAYRGGGTLLWRYDDPEGSYGHGSTALVWDVNGDGKAEIACIRGAVGNTRLALLEGETGRVLKEIPFPGINELLSTDAEERQRDFGHWSEFQRILRRNEKLTPEQVDAFAKCDQVRVFDGHLRLGAYIKRANFRGEKEARDMVVKIGEQNCVTVFAVTGDLEILWKHRVANGRGGHQVGIGDIDGDGRDEVAVGTSMLDHDGTLLWEKPFEMFVAPWEDDHMGFLDVFSGTGTISFTEKTQPEYLFRTLLPQCVSIMARLP